MGRQKIAFDSMVLGCIRATGLFVMLCSIAVTVHLCI